MKKPTGIAVAAMLLAGCTGLASSNLRGNMSLVLTPQVIDGRYQTQTTVLPYTSASIDHLVLELKTGASTVTSKTLPKASLAQSIAFNNLRNNTPYTVQAYAYLTSDNSTKISVDAQSVISITVSTDDRPTVNSIPIRLMDIPFNGLATSSGIVVNAGGYNYAASESFTVPLIVTTLAGSAATGSVNADGTAATFVSPTGVVADTSGNVYVADYDAHLIRKITPSGSVTTFAGSGLGTFADGTGTAASFHAPHALAIDAQGVLYVADHLNHRIRKITPSGVVSTFVGSGATGCADGTGTAATLRGPFGLTLDTVGNVYFTDHWSCLIRKISPAGVVTTLAGNNTEGFANGQGTAAAFDSPVGIVVDSAQNVYVGDRDNRRIRKITPAGLVTTFAGSGVDGTTDGDGVAATFGGMYGLSIDSQDNIYVADTSNQKIRKISSTGVVTTFAGNGSYTPIADGVASSATFYAPRGVSVDARGNIYVADFGSHRIRRVH